MTPFEKFQQTIQPPLKLQIAVEHYFAIKEKKQNEWQAYEQYLKMRSFSALEYLAKQQDFECLQKLLATGWITKEQCKRVLNNQQILDTRIRCLLQTMATGQATSSGEWKEKMKPECLLLKWQRKLSMEYPALRLVLNEFPQKQADMNHALGTDGNYLYYDKHKLEDLEKSGQGYVVFLHTIVHNLLGHWSLCGKIQEDLLDVAADVAAEYWLEQIFAKRLPPSCQTEKQENSVVKSRLFPTEMQYGDVVKVARYLQEHKEVMDAVRPLVEQDDHKLWRALPSQKQEIGKALPDDNTSGEGQNGQGKKQQAQCQIKERWLLAQKEMLHPVKPIRPRFGLACGSRREKCVLREKGKYDFSRYLRRFTVVREEMMLDMESFDYIPYYYGMQRFGNLPLLEPLEYTEAAKVEELVIAIDTSGSCTVAVVQRFLEETKKILTNQENFFRKMNVHIIQCDSMIQNACEIHSIEEWNEYIEDLTIEGRGGTDFTPVFAYVEKQQEEGRLKNLKGLLYFTDGDGVYPRNPTPYETAFVFLDQRFLTYDIPKWIVCLCLKEKQ